MIKFHLGKFLAFLLTSCLLFSLPQIINYFVVHNSVTHQLEKAPKQTDNWRRSEIALKTSQRTNLIWRA